MFISISHNRPLMSLYNCRNRNYKRLPRLIVHHNNDNFRVISWTNRWDSIDDHIPYRMSSRYNFLYLMIIAIKICCFMIYQKERKSKQKKKTKTKTFIFTLHLLFFVKTFFTILFIYLTTEIYFLYLFCFFGSGTYVRETITPNRKK